MPVRRLPVHPSLDHLKHQAKDLLRDHAAHSAAAAQRIREFHPRFARSTDTEIFAAPLKLADAQLAIARESGFPSWPRLKRHIEKPTLTDRLDLPHHERIEDASFRRAVELIDAGDAEALRAYLTQHPQLIHRQVSFEGWNYFHHPSLLEFIAENPIRRGKLAPNIVEITRVLLDAAPSQSAKNETLMLVATGSVARECRLQTALIELLRDHGADPDSAAEPAALHHGVAALEALIRLGARLTLPVAAALNRFEDFRRLLPDADAHARHLALSMAADYGYAEIGRLLLDAGEDPNRYNPVGGHSHTTPLHQAAAAGHFDVVKLLVERGARLDRKDILWHGTPADWAHHAGNSEIEAWLRARERSTGPGE